MYLNPIIQTLEGIETHIFNVYTTSAFKNSVDPDQLASDEASWSGSTLFFIHVINPYL